MVAQTGQQAAVLVIDNGRHLVAGQIKQQGHARLTVDRVRLIVGNDTSNNIYLKLKMIKHPKRAQQRLQRLAEAKCIPEQFRQYLHNKVKPPKLSL
jgi:hypothetical protein